MSTKQSREEEAEAAAFYQGHKDDPEVWGEPLAPQQTRQRGGLGVSITVRFSADEAELIRQMATRHGMTYSQLVRKAVNDTIRPRVTFEPGGYEVTLPPRPNVTGNAVQKAEIVLEEAYQRRAFTANAKEPRPEATRTP